MQELARARASGDERCAEGLAEAPEKAPAALQKKDPQEPPLNPEWQFETPAWVH